VERATGDGDKAGWCDMIHALGLQVETLLQPMPTTVASTERRFIRDRDVPVTNVVGITNQMNIEVPLGEQS
jgi:hypothetical protein